MAKTEKQHVADMEQRIAEFEVLFKRREKILPDVPHPKSGATKSVLTTGWVYNVYTKLVSVACSSSIQHAVGRTDRTTSQYPRNLYSTESLALEALQAEMEAQMLQELGVVEARIKQAKVRENAMKKDKK